MQDLKPIMITLKKNNEMTRTNDIFFLLCQQGEDPKPMKQQNHRTTTKPWPQIASPKEPKSTFKNS